MKLFKFYNYWFFCIAPGWSGPSPRQYYIFSSCPRDLHAIHDQMPFWNLWNYGTCRFDVQGVFRRVLIEKHLEHQIDMFHNFIDFKKAFDRVWHEGLWDTMRRYNIDEDLVQIIQALYKKTSSQVLLNNEMGSEFTTTVGVRQGCLLSPVMFNIFLERIMQDTLNDHITSISIGGKSISNLRFADDIDLMAGSNHELQQLKKCIWLWYGDKHGKE